MTSLLPLTSKSAIPPFQAEIQLLLWCSRNHTDAATTAQIKAAVCQDIHWSALVAIATVHGVASLVYQSLSHHCADAVPQESFKQLRHLFHTNALRNQFLAQELVNILELLKFNKINAVPFKGPTLAALAYGNLGLRHFSDLDILVHPKHFLKARTLLLAHGYERGIKHVFLSGEKTQDSEILKNLGEYPLRRKDGLVAVDLHQRLVTGREFFLSGNFDHFWDKLDPVALLNKLVQTFCPEALLVYLCIHGTKEFWRRLIWVCDVAELIQAHPSMNWPQVIAQAHQLRVEQMLYLGLSLTQDLLDTPLPKEIEHAIQTKFKQRSLAATLQKRLRGEVNHTEQAMSAPERLLFSLQMTESLRDQTRTILRMIAYWIPPTIEDQKFWPLPRHLYFLYYLIRPIRLLRKYGLRSLQRSPMDR